MIVSKIFDDNEKKQLRITKINENTYVSALDVLKVITESRPGQSVPKTYSRLCAQYKKFTSHTRFKFQGQGQKDTPVIIESELAEFITIFLSKSGMSAHDKRKWLERLNGNTIYIPCVVKTENEIISTLMIALARFEPKKQFYVKPYFIDLYLHSPRIAIECDEYNHRHYKQDDERVRSSYITDRLKCSWVRFDPYAKGFDIGHVISDVLDLIMK